ncbi:MAG: hypothetical protein WD768_11695 [Phycisphaeraceae bacterium]
MKSFRWIAVLSFLGFIVGLTGCMAKPDVELTKTFQTGEFGTARAYMVEKTAKLKVLGEKDKPDRNYGLEWMRTGMVTLADGYAPEGFSAWDRVYYMLRKQNLNSNISDVGAFFGTQDMAKIWKGEPFEQSLAYVCVGSHYAMQGSWDNARAAFQNSTFPLKAIKGKDDATTKKVRSTQDVINASKNVDESKYFGKDNILEVETNFAMGYLLQGLASRQIAIANGDASMLQQAGEAFNKALKLDPGLSALVNRLNDSSSYNTVLLVDYGRGPQKIGTGPDNSIAAFKALKASGSTGVSVVNGSESISFTPICDVNGMAVDHRWNNLQDMRTAKSYLGTGLLVAGAATAAIGQSQETAIIGLILMAGGAALKATAYADTRYCEVMPQRYYLVPVMIKGPNSTIRLSIEGNTTVLAGLSPPSSRQAQFRYVRLLTGPNLPAWTKSGQILYANEHAPMAGAVALPYILGGTCVSPPSAAALARYRSAGYLRAMTVAQLEGLYRQEGITWTTQDTQGQVCKHVLEGGNSLVCPLPGTLGYARLFGQPHRPYSPKSKEVADLARSLAPPPAEKAASR